MTVNTECTVVPPKTSTHETPEEARADEESQVDSNFSQRAPRAQHNPAASTEQASIKVPTRSERYLGRREDLPDSWVYADYLKENKTFSMPHPILPNARLYLAVDVTHVLKSK